MCSSNKQKKKEKNKKKKWPQETFSQLKTKCRVCHWLETQKEKNKTKKKKNGKIKKKKNKKKGRYRNVLFHFLPPDSFVSIQIQMVVWHVNNLECWPLFFSPLGLLPYPRYAMLFLEYGSEKSSIATHILKCFLVNFVFCCFLCLLICLFHFFHCFRCFTFLCFIFGFSFFSFIFLFLCLFMIFF